MHPGRDETGTIRLGPTSTRTGGATQASGTDDGTESTTSSTSATGTGPAPPGMPITVIISGKAPTGLSPLLCWSRVGYVTRCDRPGWSAPCTPSPTSSPTYPERSSSITVSSTRGRHCPPISRSCSHTTSTRLDAPLDVPRSDRRIHRGRRRGTIAAECRRRSTPADSGERDRPGPEWLGQRGRGRGRYQLMRALNNGAMKQRPGREHSDPVSAIRTLTVYSWAPASNGVASVSNVPTGNDRRP